MLEVINENLIDKVFSSSVNRSSHEIVCLLAVYLQCLMLKLILIIKIKAVVLVIRQALDLLLNKKVLLIVELFVSFLCKELLKF